MVKQTSFWTPLQYNPLLLVTQDVTAYKRYIIIGYLKVYLIAIFLYYVPSYEEAYGPTSCRSSHANDPTVGSPPNSNPSPPTNYLKQGRQENLNKIQNSLKAERRSAIFLANLLRPLSDKSNFWHISAPREGQGPGGG
ncbi:hypothetical protein CEXT_318441 [Caerostris extrusa]|uniref:Uncharacterized protein n=1 Tax=Caerostris extrusa TaxID=172846 RepID=A0AAV4MYS9_CAEEX|nr:hypothetical protein CEXT_318441 [Caerostris extrusa]